MNKHIICKLCNETLKNYYQRSKHIKEKHAGEDYPYRKSKKLEAQLNNKNMARLQSNSRIMLNAKKSELKYCPCCGTNLDVIRAALMMIENR